MNRPAHRSTVGLRKAPHKAADVPPLMDIGEGEGAHSVPTRAFAALYRRQRSLLTSVFPPHENEQSVYPPASAQEFVPERFAPAPRFHRLLAQELWTLIREIGRDDNTVNGKRLYDHQMAHLIWVAASLTNGRESPTSFFIEGAPGTGKTLTLGILMQACIRLQIRGIVKGKIAYCTAKPYHLSDKVRGKGMGQRRILRAPPYAPTKKDINRRHLALRHMDKKFMDQFFPRRAWAALFAQRPATQEGATRVIHEYLRQEGLRVEKASEPMLANVVKVLASLATTVRGPSGATELLTFQPVPDGDAQIEAHTGDAAFAIPSGYPVFARENIGVSTATREGARVVLEPAMVFTSAQQIEKLQKELHRHVQVILCDEAQRREPVQFQEPVVLAGAEEPPLVFAVGSRWYGRAWERRSPSHRFLESIRRGILPDLGVWLFPSAEAAHYPAETAEAMQQLLRMFFQTLRCFEEFDLPQPSQVNTLFVVHGRLVDHVVERLRQEYTKKNPAAQVRPFHGNEEDRESLQVWFDTGRDGPNVLVSSPAVVKESLDLRSIRHLVTGTNVSADVLYHLIGRLAHGRERSNEHDRVLLTMQQFANSNLRATPFVVLDHGQKFSEDGFTWINGRALMSDLAFRRDGRMLRGNGQRHDRVKVPDTNGSTRGGPPPIKMASGRSLISRGNGQRTTVVVRHGLIKSISPLARLPVRQEEYEPENGPPSRELVRRWAAECDGAGIFDTYPSIMLAVEESHQAGENPRQALEQKIARLRERCLH